LFNFVLRCPLSDSRPVAGIGLGGHAGAGGMTSLELLNTSNLG
jgi:hypothetical protein